jgi:hypothetical protein
MYTWCNNFGIFTLLCLKEPWDLLGYLMVIKCVFHFSLPSYLILFILVPVIIMNINKSLIIKLINESQFLLNSRHILKHVKKSRCHGCSIQFLVLFQTCTTKDHIIKHGSSKNDDAMVYLWKTWHSQSKKSNLSCYSHRWRILCISDISIMLSIITV